MADDAIEAEFAAAMATAAAHVQAAVIMAQSQLESSVQSSQIRSQADIKSSQISADAHVKASSAMAQAEVQAAQTRATADIEVAQINVSNAVEVAQIRADADKSVATTHADATKDAATTGADAEKTVAQTRSDADKYSADQQSSATKASAQTRADADVRSAQTQADASRFGAEQGLEGNIYSSDKQLQGVEVREEHEDARLQVKIDWANLRWDEVFPLVVGFLDKDQPNLADTVRWSQMLADVGPPPAFRPNEVLTEQQVQQQLNGSYSRIALAVQSKTRMAEIDLAGRGFSGASPIMDAIRMGNEGYGIMASADEEVKLRLGAATANADQLLKSQAEAIEYYLRKLGAYTDLEKNLVQLSTGMVQAAAQMVSGVA